MIFPTTFSLSDSIVCTMRQTQSEQYLVVYFQENAKKSFEINGTARTKSAVSWSATNAAAPHESANAEVVEPTELLSRSFVSFVQVNVFKLVVEFR